MSTRRARGRRPGEVVELPMLRAEVGIAPPCGTCPKIPDRDEAGGPVEKHWSNAVEFDPLFFDLLQWYRECQAVGTFGDPSPVMRAVAAAFDRVERAARDERQDVLRGLVASLAKKR